MTLADATADWDPGTYHRFRGLRLRPALDLLKAMGPLPEGDVVDLGCGSGMVGPALQRLRRRLIGVDSSPAMLREAEATGAYDILDHVDIAGWEAEAPPALIFSNATLHWLPDHARLLPRLAGQVAPGGTLAVQVPGQNAAPSHRTWRDLCERLFPGRLEGEGPGIPDPRRLHAILAPLGRVSLWETTYWQELAPVADGHPVRHFTEVTFARPVLEVLDEGERADLIRAYEAEMERAYPRREDGSVLFPFRRVFYTLERPGAQDF